MTVVTTIGWVALFFSAWLLSRPPTTGGNGDISPCKSYLYFQKALLVIPALFNYCHIVLWWSSYSSCQVKGSFDHVNHVFSDSNTSPEMMIIIFPYLYKFAEFCVVVQGLVYWVWVQRQKRPRHRERFTDLVTNWLNDTYDKLINSNQDVKG